MADNRIRFSNNFVLKDNKVGINTADPQALLDVGGELSVSGASTFTSSVDIETLNVDGVSSLSSADITNLVVSGVSTLGFTTVTGLSVSGITTLSSVSATTLGVSGVSTLGFTTVTGLYVTGVSTFAGIVTSTGDLYVGGDLYVQDDLVFDSFSANSFVVAGIASASRFVGNLTGDVNSTGISTIINLVGTSLSYTGVSTFTNGPVLIGSGTSTGTTTQKLQVTGGAYVSGSVGIGTTNPVSNLDVDGPIISRGSAFVIKSLFGTNTWSNPQTATNVDHIWHLDGIVEGLTWGLGGIWNFVSDSTYQADGNSWIRAGGFANTTPTLGALYPLQISGNAYVSGNVGIGTTNPQEKLDIDGNALIDGNIIIGSTIGAASTEKMEISAVSRDNGLLEIANYGGNQLFSVSNNQSESAFSVYRYANYDNLSITAFENRNLFSVSPLGIVTTYGALRVGTSNTIADSYVYNELYGRLNVRAPFSTTTEYVSIVPKFSDKGALSFEAPVGTALTDRGTQIFSISNNVDSSIFRVNDLNRQPIFEASASGNAGIGTTNPRVPFDVATNAQFRNRVGFSQTANPNDTSVIDIQSYTPGITTYFNNSAVVITNNRSNNGENGAQIYTIEDNDNTLFRVNVLGFGLTTVSTPTTPIYQALDIDSVGDIKIFDTSTRKQIVGFTTTNPIAGDGDMFRVDAFSSPFIGSFPTVSKAVRIDKFGLVEINRNINQISGIATVGLGSTSSPSINSTMSFELTNNTTLTVRVKGTDGVIRTGIITLS